VKTAVVAGVAAVAATFAFFSAGCGSSTGVRGLDGSGLKIDANSERFQKFAQTILWNRMQKAGYRVDYVNCKGASKTELACTGATKGGMLFTSTWVCNTQGKWACILKDFNVE